MIKRRIRNYIRDELSNLSSFLKTGETSASFRLEGKVALIIIAFTNFVNQGIITELASMISIFRRFPLLDVEVFSYVGEVIIDRVAIRLSSSIRSSPSCNEILSWTMSASEKNGFMFDHIG